MSATAMGLLGYLIARWSQKQPLQILCNLPINGQHTLATALITTVLLLLLESNGSHYHSVYVVPLITPESPAPEKNKCGI